MCLITQSCPTLCDPMNSSWPRSSVHGILQARIPEWVAIFFSKIQSLGCHKHTHLSFEICMLPVCSLKVFDFMSSTVVCIKKINGTFNLCVHICSVVSNPFHPMDCSLPDSSDHGIFQARILERVAISYSKVSSQPRDWSYISYISCIGRWVLYHCVTRETHNLHTSHILEIISILFTIPNTMSILCK